MVKIVVFERRWVT